VLHLLILLVAQQDQGQSIAHELQQSQYHAFCDLKCFYHCGIQNYAGVKYISKLLMWKVLIIGG